MLKNNTYGTKKKSKTTFKGFFKEIGQVFKERTAAIQRSYRSFMQFITVDIWNLNIKDVSGIKNVFTGMLKLFW